MKECNFLFITRFINERICQIPANYDSIFINTIAWDDSIAVIPSNELTSNAFCLSLLLPCGFFSCSLFVVSLIFYLVFFFNSFFYSSLLFHLLFQLKQYLHKIHGSRVMRVPLSLRFLWYAIQKTEAS